MADDDVINDNSSDVVADDIGAAGNTNAESPASGVADDDALLAALLSRGRRKPESITLEDGDITVLVERVRRDFEDGAAALSDWYKNQVELVKNWEGVVDPKIFPYEDAANVRVPFTSVQIMQWAARILKALLGGDYITRFERLDEQIETESLEEHNQWFQWELDEEVKFRHSMERIIYQTLIGGICLPLPYWQKDRRQLVQFREFEYDQTKPISSQLQAALEIIFDGKEYEIKSMTGQGIYKCSVKDPDEPAADSFKVTFCIRNSRLCAQVEGMETTFNAVKICVPNSEDLVFINTHPDLERLPFNGLRIWLDAAEYRDGLLNGTWRDLGEDRNQRILAAATNKTPQVVPMDYTRVQDQEEGVTSTDPQAWDYERRFIEVYRWEGWIHPTAPEGALSNETVLLPAVQVAVWTVPAVQEMIRIERLEALNKGGERSMIKFSFIERNNRFLPISLAEWLRHTQAELDGIHNLRLDSGTLNVMPFGFYKPLAGMQKDVYDIKPGKMFPTADPASVNFPKTNSSPNWSLQDEALVYKYGMGQSGLSDSATGSFVSKRQSASEYIGTANAVDLRTEAIVINFMRSLRKLLYRILGLYQQFAPPTRIFQIGGVEGVKLVKRFQTDRLQGKLLLRLTGNLDQVNPQLQRDISTNMLSLLMNQILIQLGIVRPDTIYAAITHVAKSMNYKDVPIHKPDLPEQSPSPEIENKMMAQGQVVQPHLDENFDEHLKRHLAFLTDPNAKRVLSQRAFAIVMDHVQRTQKMQQIASFLRQQESLLGATMAKNMAAMGIRPGQAGGQQAGNNAGAGSQEEGVQGGESEAA